MKRAPISPLSIASFNACITLDLAAASSSGLTDIEESGLKDMTFHTRAHLVPGGGRGSSKQSYSRILTETDVEYDRQES